MPEYTGPDYVNDAGPPINAANLNALTDAVENHGARLAGTVADENGKRVVAVPEAGASVGMVPAVSDVDPLTFELVEQAVGGPAPDATTSDKGIARILGGTADAPTVPATALTGTIDDARIPAGIARDSEVTAAIAGTVALTGAQTVAGVKTFSSPPVVPDGAWSIGKTTGLQAAIDGRARVRRPEDHGAVGDGTADDTAALTALLAAVQPGETLWIAPGKVYTHTTVLDIDTDAVRIVGGGEIRATDEETSAVWFTADGQVVEDVLFSCPVTTQRWDTLDHHKVLLYGSTGTILRNVRVDGAAAAGILCYGASDYLIENAIVENTRADGIHQVAGSTRGRVHHPTTRNTGDDGVAVVSYDSGGDAGLCTDIIVTDVHVEGTTTGRGISVVGGARIEYLGGSVSDTFGAGIIVACEPAGQGNDSTDDVLFRDITVIRANTHGTGQPDHGGLLVSTDRAAHHLANVRFENVTLTDTRPGASWSIALLSTNGGTGSGIVFDNVQIRGARPAADFFSDLGESFYRRIDVGHEKRDGWELLGSWTSPGGVATSGAIAVEGRDVLMIVVRILGLSAEDIPALRFNGDTTAAYHSRYVTCADGGVALTNVATASATMAHLSGITSGAPRTIQAVMNGHPDWEKSATVSSSLNTGTAAATPPLDVAGGFEWVHPTGQVTSVELRTVGGAVIGGNSQLLVFGRNAAG